jgi:Ca-activated chloride channel family protein
VNFVHAEFLWLLLILLLLSAWSIYDRRWRRRSWQALAQRGRSPRDGRLRLMASLACLIVALAQPRWGRSIAPQSPPGHDVVLLVDVSRSMAAEDAVPNRLAVAIESAESLVNALAQEPASRAAVVAFAGRGVRVCPLTENFRAVLNVLRRLRPGVVRPGGTDLGAGLDTALDVIDPQEHAQGRAIVVFSDGEDLADRWTSRLEQLRQQDVVVHAVAIGDADHGHTIPWGKDSQTLLYHGEPVLSRRFDQTLETVARRTGGMIVPLGLASVDLGPLYQTKIEPAARRRREASRLAERAEGFPLVLIAALVFLLAGCWPYGRGWGWTWHWSWRWRRSVKNLNLGRAALLIAVAGVMTGASDGPSKPHDESAAEAVARGQAAYDAGQLDDALATFESAIQLAPQRAVPWYNAAATLFQLGRYAEARQRYVEARERADSFLRTKIDYALGNTALVLGEIPAAIAYYDACLASTAHGKGLDAVRRDAGANRRFALEQPQPPAISQGESSGDQPKSQRPDRRRNSNRNDDDADSPDGQPETGQGGAGNSESELGADDQNKRPSTRRRRTGGAGGGRSTAPGTHGDSPDDRLDAALENIRAAQSRRLPDDPPPATANDDRRDW